MPEFLSITSLLFVKTDFNFYLEKTGSAKTGAAIPFPPALERVRKITDCHLTSTQ